VEQAEKSQSKMGFSGAIASVSPASDLDVHKDRNGFSLLQSPEVHAAAMIPTHLTRGLYVERPLHLRFLPGMTSLDSTLGDPVNGNSHSMMGKQDYSDGNEAKPSMQSVQLVKETSLVLSSISGGYGKPRDHMKVMMNRLPSKSDEMHLRRNITRGFRRWEWDVR